MADEKVLVEFKVDASGAIREVRQFKGEVSEASRSAATASTGLGKMSGALKAAGIAAGAFAAYKLAGTLTNIARSAITTGANFERLGVQMKSIMGSIEGGKAATEWVTQFTASTPYQLEQVSEAFVKLKAFGINPTTGALQAIADQTSMLGGSMETMNAIILAVGKAYSKGKIEAEEWNMMAERGVRVSQLFAEALGMTEAQVVELRSQGKLGREEIEKFLGAMGGAAAGASLEFMDTFNGKWSNLKDNVALALNEIASNGALDALTEGMDGIIRAIRWAIESGAIAEFGRAFAASIKTALSFVGPLAEGLLKLLEALASVGTTAGELRMGLQVMDVDAWTGKLDRLKEKQRELNEQYGDATYWTDEMRESQADLAAEIRETQAILDKSKKKLNAIEAATSGFADAQEALGSVIEIVNGGLEKQTGDEGLKKLPALLDDTASAATGAARAVETKFEPVLRRGAQTVYDALEETNKEAAAVALAIVGIGDAMAAAGRRTPEIKDPLEELADDWQRTLEDMRTQVFTQLGDVFVDVITGQTDDIGEAFGGIVDTFARQWANQASAAFGMAMDAQPGQRGAAFASAGGWQGLGGMAGSAIMSYGMQSGSRGTAIASGVIGGAIQGFIVSGGNPIGAVVGAIIGGAAGYFGSGNDLDPYMFLRYEQGGGGARSGFQFQGNRVHDTLEEASAQREFLRDLNALMRAGYGGYRDTLQMLALATGNTGLVSNLGAIESFDFGRIEGGPQEVTNFIANEWLPAQLDAIFGPAFREGLADLGVSEGTTAALFRELGALGIEDRLGGLTTFISAIASAQDLLAEMDWDTMLQRVGEDSMTQLFGGLDDISQRIGVLGSGWDSLSLLEQAEELDQINQLMAQAREAEIQMLRQIDQLQQSINRSIDQQIEGIRTGGMTDAQRQAYYLDQARSIMASLRAGAYSSPEALQMAMGDLQSYISQYASAMGDDLYTALTPSGMTYADMIVNMLEEARGLSDTALEGMRDQIEAANQALIDELARLTDAIINYGGAGQEENPVPTVPPPERMDVFINVDAGPLFDAYVTNVVRREIAATNAQGPY